MIAAALAVIIGVVAVTCGIVADSNHADTLTFLGLMVKTTAAQIFLAGAICTWALFASLWLLSVGIRRSKERGVELRLLKVLRRPALSGVTGPLVRAAVSGIAGLAPAAGTAKASRTDDRSMSAPIPADAIDPADSEPTIDFSDLEGFRDFDRFDHLGHLDGSDDSDNLSSPNARGGMHSVARPGHERGRRSNQGRFYGTNPRPNSAD